MAFAPGQVFNFRAKYATETDFYFTLNDPGSSNGDLFNGTAPVGADSTISKDGGAEAATTNAASQITGSGFIYKLTLTAAEMTASRIMVAIRDATATEIFGPVTLLIETFGEHALGSSAVFGKNPFDISPSAENTSVPSQTLSWGKQIQSILARFYNRATQTGPTGNQIVYRNDDATALATMAVTDDGSTQTKGKAT